MTLPGPGNQIFFIKTGGRKPRKVRKHFSPNIACNMGSWRRSNKISMKCGWRVGRSPLPVFYHTFCTLGAFRLREMSYRELKPCKLQWFLHLRVVKIVRKIAKVKKFTKMVPVRAGKLSTTPFCTEFRRESNRADGISPTPLFCKVICLGFPSYF